MKNKEKNNKLSYELILLLVFAVAFVGIGMGAPDKFFTLDNLTSMSFQMPELGILALAMMAPILTGGINLAVATTGSLAGITGALVLSSPLGQSAPLLSVIIAIVLILATGFIAGCINGYFTGFIGIAAMLVTLGSTTLFEGIGLNITRGGAISGFPSIFMSIGNDTFLGVLPYAMIIYIACAILSYFLLERSVWGIKVHMLGSNNLATEYAGVNTKIERFKVFLYSGVMSGVAGVIMISRYNSAKIDYGSSYVMQTITAVVLGGTSIYGGSGTVLGTVIAVAIIQVVSTGLNIIGVDRNLIDVTIGAILLMVLSVRHFSEVFSDKKRIKARN